VRLIADDLAKAARDGPSQSGALVNDHASSSSSSSSSPLYLPDDRSIMVPAPSLLFNDAPWLLAGGRVKPSTLRCAHAALTRPACDQLGVSAMSEQVIEQIADGFVPQLLTPASNQGDDVSNSTSNVSKQLLQEPPRLTALLSSPEVAAAVARILDAYGGGGGSARMHMNSSSAAGGGGESSASSLATSLHEVLKSCEVVFVEGLRSKFVRCHCNGTREDVTALPGGDQGSLHFVEAEGTNNAPKHGQKRILVARLALPPSIGPSFVVARAIAHSILPNYVFGMGSQSSGGSSSSSGGSSSTSGSARDGLVAPLAAVLGCGGPNEVSGVLRLLQLEEDARVGEGRRRGMPGERLLDEDRKCVGVVTI